MTASSRLSLLFCAVAAVTAAACGSDNRLFCDDDTPCTELARPFCDTRGEFPASEGIANTCIPYPVDASVIDAAPALEPDGSVADASQELPDAGPPDAPPPDAPPDAPLPPDASVAIDASLL